MIAFFVFRKQRQVHNMSHSRSWFLFLFRNQSNAHNMSQLSNLQYVYISFSQEGSRHHSFSMDYVYYQCVHHKKRGCRVSSIGGEDCVRQVYPGRCTVGEVLYFLWGSMPRKKGVRKMERKLSDSCVDHHKALQFFCARRPQMKITTS